MNQHDCTRHHELHNDDGASAVEYGLLTALIAGAIIGIVVTIGPQVAAALSITW